MRADADAVRAWFPRLDAQHKRLVFTEHLLGAALVNFALNAAIAWVAFPYASIPLWGLQSVAGDTLSTGFVLPMLTCLIVDRIVGRRVLGGRLRALSPGELPSPAWRSWPSARKGAILGAAGVLCAALPVVACLDVAGVSQMPRASFVWFKALFATGLGSLVTPPIAWWALVRASAPPAG